MSTEGKDIEMGNATSNSTTAAATTTAVVPQPGSSEWLSGVLGATMGAVNASNSLPDSDDYEYYSSLGKFRDGVDGIGERALQLSQEIIGVADPELEKRFAAQLAAGRYRSGGVSCGDGGDELLDDVFVGLFDTLLDSVDTFSDEQAGNRHVPTLVVNKAAVTDGAVPVEIIYGRNVPRPQALFPDRVDNFPKGPWVPRITEKPNATVPLADVFQEFNDACRAHEARLLQKKQQQQQQKPDEKAASPAPTAVKPAAPLPPGISSHIEGLGVSAKSGVDRSTSPFIEHEEEGGSTSKAREKGEDEEEKEKEEEVMFPHPYQYELEHLAYPEWELAPQEVQAYGVLEKTPVTWVGTAEALDALVEKLRGERAVAIDLEAHSLRSYEGFTCLMQVSTRAEDFLVDTLALRGRLHVLNTVFTDPCVLKVLHGCDWDVLWLQRDFALYLVNCFDTGQAARVLGLPSFALKYLLQLYCNVEADKRYQLADWRIRPLPPEMFDYARGDTHYLLYIYDRMKADLLARAGGAPTLLAEVLDRSRNICLSRYRPTPPPTAAAARRILLRDRSGNGASSSSSSGHRSFTRLQTAVLEELYRWRDTVARREDESVRYILPNHMLLRVAELLPTSLPELLKTCNPVPVVFHTNGADIVDIIRRTKKQQDALTAHLPVKVLPPMPDHPTHTVFSEADDNDSGNGSATKDKSTLATATATATDTTTTTATKTSASGNGNDDNNGDGGGGDDDDEVLTTDQLYKLAGWEEKTDESNDVAMSNSSHTKTDAQAVKSSSLFDDSSDDDDDDAIINSGGNSSASAAASVIEFPPLTATFQEKPKKDKEENAGEEDEEEGASTVTTIPKTMEEIYKLSNANRKRNKEKRKLKEESGKLHSNADDSSDNEEPDQKAPNTAKPTVEDKHEFMKKIGWVESTDADTTTTTTTTAAAAATTEHQQPQSQTATQKQGIRIERRKPGIASTKKQQQQQQQQKAFTSYDYNKINSLSVRSSFGMNGSGKGKQQQQLQQQHSQQQGKKKEKVPTGPKQPNFGGQQKQPHTSKFQRGAVSQSFGGLGTTAAPAKPAWKK